MKKHGLLRKKKSRSQNRPTAIEAFERAQKRETRLFESPHSGSLWHLDFHHCSRQILTANGLWQTPICLSVIDDHSRLICHMQWYLQEDYGRLILEQSTWASHYRVEKVARSDLDMQAPDLALYKVVPR